MVPFITIFGRALSVYVLLALAGIFAAGFAAVRKASKAGLDDTGVITLLLIAAAGALAGGHLLYALVNYRLIPRLFDATSAGVFLERLGFIAGGQVFYGGLLGGLAAGTLYGAKKFGPAWPQTGDMLVPLIPLFHFFGRLGCFAAGCCYGMERAGGIVFTRSVIAEANGASRFPVQLVEAAFNLALFCGLSFAEGRFLAGPEQGRCPRGRLLYLYLLCYAAGRFALEFFRSDTYRGFWGPFSTSQWISLGLAAVSVTALIRNLICCSQQLDSRPCQAGDPDGHIDK
jgi:phosphatidylglycerol:prolipoprotein diacylglycerol transferase